MQGDPIHPISLEKARKDIWQRLAANAELDVQTDVQKMGDGPPVSPADGEREAKLKTLRLDADEKLMGLLIVDDLRAWAADGENWKLLPPRAMVHRATGAHDEPSGVYIDRQELAAALERRWPEQFANLVSPSPPISANADASPKGPGRTPGSGSYAEDDAPFVLEMRELVIMGKARSVSQAARMVAERAIVVGGGTFESRVTRLRKRYKDKFGVGA